MNGNIIYVADFSRNKGGDDLEDNNFSIMSLIFLIFPLYRTCGYLVMLGLN